MYENISRKSKLLASWLGGIYIASGVIGFIVILAKELSFWYALGYFAGCALLFCSTWLIYGFGHLIENTEVINDKLKNAPEPISNELPEL